MKEKKKKSSKYNYGEAIDLDLIPIDDTERALFEFSEGSNGLQKCLRVMWMNGLKTHSCRSGMTSSFDIGRIVMEEKEDVFSYLSKEFLNDERIRINFIDNKEEIRVAGSNPEKEGAFLFLAREIQTGKKKGNQELILQKIGKEYADSWIRRLKSHDSNINSTYWSEKIYIKEKD